MFVSTQAEKNDVASLSPPKLARALVRWKARSERESRSCAEYENMVELTGAGLVVDSYLAGKRGRLFAGVRSIRQVRIRHGGRGSLGKLLLLLLIIIIIIIIIIISSTVKRYMYRQDSPGLRSPVHTATKRVSGSEVRRQANSVLHWKARKDEESCRGICRKTACLTSQGAVMMNSNRVEGSIVHVDCCTASMMRQQHAPITHTMHEKGAAGRDFSLLLAACMYSILLTWRG
ncbi:hypothetical protein CERZMDRAFT_89122 [Cercospora zeae-maydis SCOH1-5]|uniref:Uncharacterized protein n=1 Tax=Cercospora zeae-maydis SCOH1-5 TaxID=717836 RepID=A0A6A6EZV3_9PEZI|nr:hypothetical protein CERZMDRAFT_89122 [Cercospora zeae-maydis SCOH1-5]